MGFLKRCKNELLALFTDCKTEVVVNGAKYRKLVSWCLFGASMVNMGGVAIASQAGIDTFAASITEVISDIYTHTVGIVTILAALLLVIALITRMTSNQQKAAQATQWIVRIIICYVCINCIGLIFTVIRGVTSQHSDPFDPTDPTNSGG